MREHEAVNSGCAKVRSLQYLQTWQMIVSGRYQSMKPIIGKSIDQSMTIDAN